jgi:hypothetical protein
VRGNEDTPVGKKLHGGNLPVTTTDVLGSLRSALARLLRWSRRVRKQRRTTAARERFWSEVREGEREAESRARP